MRLHQQHVETETEMRLLSRRTLFGITGVGLASLLVACGDDDEVPPAGDPGVPAGDDDLPADDPAVDDPETPVT